MARFKDPEASHHLARLRSDGDDGELLIVGKGKQAYLWIGRDVGNECVTFSGQQTLRKLARLVLKTIPAKK